MVKEVEQKFQFFLCKLFRRLPSDSFFDEMDPMERAYLFQSWLEEHSDEIEKLRTQGILIGSFTNPEAAKDMLKGPDFETSDEDMEAAWDYIQNQPIPENAALEGIKEGKVRNSRRRRKVIK